MGERVKLGDRHYHHATLENELIMRSTFNQSDTDRAGRRAKLASSAGFSLIELIIAMAILLAMMAGASRLLMNSLGARTRENQKSDALADAQRALNIMSREIGNSGFGINGNGLVWQDCHPTSASDPITAQIRLRANVNNSDNTTNQADENVTYVYQGAPTNAIVRYDAGTNTRTVLANGIDSMQITYINAAGATSTTASQATIETAVRVRLTVQVNLQPTVGQPASQVLLTSDIALRNAPSVIGNY
ncbi:MAG TPA: type II secretion system protein [Pyrinomonadaceae bacterium]|nr:type II secretion system protein [Pyrinomonadaceae bacterium]